MKLAAFPQGAAFLPALAKAWLHGGNDDGLIILPSLRAARALTGAFLQANAGQALLLPRIIALGGVDETALSLAGSLTLPPAIPPLRRQAILARLILQLHGKAGAPRKPGAAWALAGDLATLLDEADYAGIDLGETLPGVVAAELAAHWQTTLEFLQIVTRFWPGILAAEGAVNAARRQVMLLDAQSEAWRAKPPPHRIWLVMRDGNPAACRLARVVAGLPQGLLLLPGYDPALSEDAWAALEDTHPQAGIAQLIAAIGARREEIQAWDAPAGVPAGRAALLSRAMLPAACLSAWQMPAALNTDGLYRLEARDEQEDATAIAMTLRDALETSGGATSGRSVALITPDRGLAIRVAAALRRFGIAADDSAGEPLAETPPAVFLRLLARAAAAEFAPLPLLALLQHPLTAAGLPAELCRENARLLERLALRGPRPPPGLAGLRFRLDDNHRANEKSKKIAGDFLTRLEMLLTPLASPAMANPAAALRALIVTGEAMAATEAEAGAARLWSGEAGTALSDLLLEALGVLASLPEMRPGDLPELLDALLAGPVVRRPRSRDSHPRIAIWGTQEAMLQSVDVAVLAGLNEGVWPATAEPGPWLSRPMRKAAGLPAPEEEIGRAAHDMVSLAASCATVVFAAPSRRERAPAVPSRWLTRLEAMLAGSGQNLKPHPAASWAAQLDLPVNRERRPKPKPRPPATARPRELSISDIATLIADPYAIYARKVLNIHKLDRLDEESDQSEFGNIVHAGLAKFFSVERDFAAPNAVTELTAMLETAMREARPRAALQHWWEARLERIAGWIVDAETERRRSNPPVAMELEVKAKLDVPGGFILNGRADRIEKRADGTVFIMDYKSGSVPKAKEIKDGSKPQLPLEAVMAEAGAFGAAFAAEVTALSFWRLSGRHKPGEDKPILPKPDELRAAIDAAAASLPALFGKFADARTPYLARPHPDRSTYEDVYSGMSRNGEWGGEEGDDGGA